MKKNATCWLFPSGKWWKILLIMKLKIFFLLVSLGTLQAAGYSQDSRFNLKKNDVLLTEVLQELQQQSEYRFFYQKDIFQQADRVNVDMKNVSLRQILDEVLIRHGFSYEMIDKVITIRKIQQQKTAGRKITGIVMDTRKQSLPGVTVLLKGTALGVVTDKEGRFNIEIPETDPIVLVFSFVGMKKQEVTYTGQEDIQVVMEEEVTEMDEVVITGYQVIDRKKLTSAITSVKAEDIMIPGVNSIDQMLEGRIPAFEDSGNFDLGWQSRTVVGCQWRSGERSGAFGFGCAQRPRLCKSHRKCDCRIKPSGYPTDRCIERRCCNYTLRYTCC